MDTTTPETVVALATDMLKQDSEAVLAFRAAGQGTPERAAAHRMMTQAEQAAENEAEVARRAPKVAAKWLETAGFGKIAQLVNHDNATAPDEVIDASLGDLLGEAAWIRERVGMHYSLIEQARNSGFTFKQLAARVFGGLGVTVEPNVLKHAFEQSVRGK